MLLPSRDGIACDFCATQHKEKFSYFSLRATQYRVAGTQKFPGTDPKFSKDMCPTCYGELCEEIMRFIGPHKRGSIKDDLSKDYGTGNFEYWVVLFDKVEVDKEQPEEHQVTVEKRVLDMNLIHFEEFKKRAEKAEEKMKKTGAWS